MKGQHGPKATNWSKTGVLEEKAASRAAHCVSTSSGTSFLSFRLSSVLTVSLA